MAQMANKTIKMELSHKSIQDTIKQLRAYQKSLASKNEEFVRRLAELGIPVIDFLTSFWELSHNIALHHPAKPNVCYGR